MRLTEYSMSTKVNHFTPPGNWSAIPDLKEPSNRWPFIFPQNHRVFARGELEE